MTERTVRVRRTGGSATINLLVQEADLAGLGGPKGDIGPAGARGPVGGQGPTGRQGTRGDDGDDAAIALAAVVAATDDDNRVTAIRNEYDDGTSRTYDVIRDPDTGYPTRFVLRT